MPLPPEIRAVVDAAVDATVVVDLDLYVLHHNPAYAHLAGIRERDLRRGRLRALCHEHFGLETCSDGGCLALRALERRRHIRVDEVRTSQPHQRLVVTALPLFGGASEPYAVMETYRDVTAESRMQANYKELLSRARRHNEVLQEEVARRTAELSHSLEMLRATRSQLIQSEKMSSLGQLVAGIAHELNNPINHIYGNVDFVAERAAALLALVDGVRRLALPPEQRRDLERLEEELDIAYVRSDLAKVLASLQDGSERAATLVRQLRTFSHRGRVDARPFDLNDGIATTLSLVKLQAKGRVRIVRELDHHLPRIQCNGPEINQVVMNLVINAIQAIEGSGTLTVRSRLGDGGTVVVEVEDTGSGMPADVMEKIFDPFFTTKDVGEGTGLGLSISFGIVQAHGGALDVTSELGKGSVFRMTLSIEGSIRRSGAEPAPSPAEGTLDASGPPERH